MDEWSSGPGWSKLDLSEACCPHPCAQLKEFTQQVKEQRMLAQEPQHITGEICLDLKGSPLWTLPFSGFLFSCVLFMCVCIHIHMHVGAGVCMGVHAHVCWGLRSILGIFPDWSSPLFIEGESPSQTQSFAGITSLASPFALGFPVSPFQVWNYKWVAIPCFNCWTTSPAISKWWFVCLLIWALFICFFFSESRTILCLKNTQEPWSV